jgi:hypothetical protein
MLNVDIDGNSEQGDFWAVGVNDQKSYSDGFKIFRYSVPKDLPRNKNIILVIEIIKPDREFVKLYGKQKLIVVKESDE